MNEQKEGLSVETREHFRGHAAAPAAEFHGRISDDRDEEGRPAVDDEDASVSLIPEEELDKHLHQLFVSKAEEFKLLGYEHVTAEEIRECVYAKYKKGERPALHRLVNDILSLKVTQFMNWLTLQAYKQPEIEPYEEWI